MSGLADAHVGGAVVLGLLTGTALVLRHYVQQALLAQPAAAASNTMADRMASTRN